MILSAKSIERIANFHLGRFGFIAKIDEDGDVCLYERRRRLVKTGSFTALQDFDFFCMVIPPDHKNIFSCLHIIKRRDGSKIREAMQKALMSTKRSVDFKNKEASKAFRSDFERYCLENGFYGKKAL